MSVSSEQYARAGRGRSFSPILVTRMAAEAVNTFVWESANWLWAVAALGCMAFLMWPLLALRPPGSGRLFRDNIPILAYLLLSVGPGAREPGVLDEVRLCGVYRLFCFAFTIETGSQLPEAMILVRRWSVRLVKFLVVLGLAALWSTWCRAILSVRGSCSVYGRPGASSLHPPTYMVVVLPFVFYFLKERDYLWLLLLGVACVATGTRSPLMAAACLAAMPAAKSVLRVRFTWIDLAIAAVVVVAAYWFVLTWTASHEVTEDFNSRTSTGSMQWRIAFWQNFLVFDDPNAPLVRPRYRRGGRAGHRPLRDPALGLHVCAA